tara:strand:- start:9021 stop:11822 length:2802 start_codon:yes stop_codon:yes gene_type:complete
MRTGDTQSVPSSTPDIYLEIQTGSPEDVSSRITKFKFDEQMYGGIWEVWLDNADSALAAKDYVGFDVDLQLGFSGGTRSVYPKLWIDTQEFESIEGKLLMKLTIIDAWGLMVRVNAAVGAQYWNYPDQAAGLPDADAAHYDKTIEEIITSVIQSALNGTFALDKDHDDNYYDTLKPPIRIDNARTGVFQLMELTDSFLRYEADNDFHVRQASKESSVYTFTLASNHFWTDAEGSGATIPNRVIFYGSSNPPTTVGDLSATATDSTSVTRIGINIDKHFYYGHTEAQLILSQGTLDSLAAAAILKIQGQRSQGALEAPMHCSLELLDKITITDTRYSGTKTITGFVHRMVREYEANKDIYKITVYLGGTASGYTPSGSRPLISKSDDPEPSPMGLPFTPSPAFLPIVIDIAFSITDWNTVTWGSGTIKTAAGHSFTINSGSLDMANGNVYYLYYDTDTNDGDLDNTQTFTNTVAQEKLLVGFLKRGASSSHDPKVVIGTVGEDLFIDKLSAIAADMGLLTAGEIRVGEGSLAGGTFTGWRLWVEANVGRMGGFNTSDGSDPQWYSDTDGKLYAGGGGVILDSNGITVNGQVLIFKNAGVTVGYVYGYAASTLAIAGADNLNIHTAAGGGISVGAGSAPTTPTANDLRLEADADVFLDATDDFDVTVGDTGEILCGDRFSIGSGGVNPSPSLDDILLSAGAKMELAGATGVRIYDPLVTDDIDGEDTSVDIGSGTAFDDIYCDTIHYNGGSLPDDFDDLALILALRNSISDPSKLDMSSLPDILKYDKVKYMTKVTTKLDKKDERNKVKFQEGIERLQNIEQGLDDERSKTQFEIKSMTAKELLESPTKKTTLEGKKTNLTVRRDKLKTKRRVLQQKLNTLGNDRKAQLAQWENRFEFISKHFIPANQAIGLALGGLKQAAQKIEALEARVAELE